MAKKVVLAGACRTAIGTMGGSLSTTPAAELGAIVIKEALNRAGVAPEQVDQVYMGCVIQAGLGQNVARQASIKAGLPIEVPAVTMNVVCGSGLNCVNQAAQMILAGDADVVVAGGMENMSMSPYRGTALKGMGGIAPVSGRWIRPLLCVKRAEIESYLGKWGISYCKDKTNMQNIYTRNRIRNEIIPLMESRMNEQTVLHIAETAQRMRTLGDYIGREAVRLLHTCAVKEEEGGLLLGTGDYYRIDEALRPYVLYEAICTAAGHRKDIEAVHVRLTEELLKKQPGRRLDFPYGLTAVRCYEGIRFSTQKMAAREEEDAGFQLRIIKKCESAETFPQKNYTKWFDYDIIKNTVKIRHREPGDYLTIDKYGNTQKLKQFFINQKIPQEKRSRIWLAADGPHIMWVVGYRQNQMYQVTDKTSRILEIEFYGGEKDGRDD